ncbi:MAG: hypothetical protein PG977_000734 [Bartonella clarridgeiae]|nr:MAG: hypothetical protein PG977_000734 [Bartonella clarridgeiae]
MNALNMCYAGKRCAGYLKKGVFGEVIAGQFF